MDLSEQANQPETENNQSLLSLKEPEEPYEPDLEYNHHTKTSYDDDELDQRRINMGHFGVSDVTPSIKKNETNSHFSNGLVADKNNFDDDNRPKILSGRCNFRGHNLEDAKRDVPFQIFDELDKSIHIPKKKKKLVKKQIILDDFEENSSEEEKSAANIDWREVESVTRQSLCGSDHDKSLLSVDLLEEGINPDDIPKAFPEKSCYSTIHRLIISLFSSLKAYFKSFVKTNKKNQ